MASLVKSPPAFKRAKTESALSLATLVSTGPFSVVVAIRI
jgi:hypothetical protein